MTLTPDPKPDPFAGQRTDTWTMGDAITFMDRVGAKLIRSGFRFDLQFEHNDVAIHLVSPEPMKKRS